MGDPPPNPSADSTWIPNPIPPLTTTPADLPGYPKMKPKNDQPLEPSAKVQLGQSDKLKQVSFENVCTYSFLATVCDSKK